MLHQRSNIVKALITGIEAFAEMILLEEVLQNKSRWNLAAFVNAAFEKSEFTEGEITAVKGKEL